MTMTLATTPRPELDPLLRSGVIAVVRVSEPVRLGPAARALAAGGVGGGEGTPTTPGAIDAIADLASDKSLPGGVIGAGPAPRESPPPHALRRRARFVG